MFSFYVVKEVGEGLLGFPASSSLQSLLFLLHILLVVLFFIFWRNTFLRFRHTVRFLTVRL